MPSNKKHHYVPKFYAKKNFADAERLEIQELAGLVMTGENRADEIQRIC